MDRSSPEALIEHLASYVTEHKLALIERALQRRTRHLAVVLEDIYQAHNASAVVRSCDLFGVQELHVVENRNRYTINPAVSVGASKWVDLHRYNERGADNTARCIDELHRRGYRVIATTPHRDETLLPDLPVEQPTALLFGTEESGLSPGAMELADGFVRIEQTGFTESFNLSVSVAITLYELTKRLWSSEQIDWRLNPTQLEQLRLRWLRKIVRNHEKIEARFLASGEPDPDS